MDKTTSLYFGSKLRNKKVDPFLRVRIVFVGAVIDAKLLVRRFGCLCIAVGANLVFSPSQPMVVHGEAVTGFFLDFVDHATSFVRIHLVECLLLHQDVVNFQAFFGAWADEPNVLVAF